MEKKRNVLIVLGTQKFPMNRLLKQIDKLTEILTEYSFFAQIGHSDYQPKNYSYVRFLEGSEFEAKISSCDILITHSGVGTIMTGLRHEKKVIVFPRREEFGEHIDNHQCEIAEAFEKQGYIIVCNQEADLEKTIRICNEIELKTFVSKREQVIEYINQYIYEGNR